MEAAETAVGEHRQKESKRIYSRTGTEQKLISGPQTDTTRYEMQHQWATVKHRVRNDKVKRTEWARLLKIKLDPIKKKLYTVLTESKFPQRNKIQ